MWVFSVKCTFLPSATTTSIEYSVVVKLLSFLCFLFFSSKEEYRVSVPDLLRSANFPDLEKRSCLSFFFFYVFCILGGRTEFVELSGTGTETVPNFPKCAQPCCSCCVCVTPCRTKLLAGVCSAAVVVQVCAPHCTGTELRVGIQTTPSPPLSTPPSPFCRLSFQ